MIGGAHVVCGVQVGRAFCDAMWFRGSLMFDVNEDRMSKELKKDGCQVRKIVKCFGILLTNVVWILHLEIS